MFCRIVFTIGHSKYCEFYFRRGNVCMYVCRFTSFITTIIWWKSITITKVIKYPVIAWRKWILLYLCLSERLTNQCSKSLLIGGRTWGFGGLILEMDKVDFTVRMSFLTTNHEGEINSTQTVTPQRKHLDSLTTLKWLQRIYSGYLHFL